MKRKIRGGDLRPDVLQAIEEAWPGHAVDGLPDIEECWFWDVRSKLVRAFGRLKSVRLLYQLEAIPERSYPDHIHDDGDDDDESWPDYDEHSRSYHLFFLSPNGDEFDSETECEVEADPEYDEETGEEILDGERETITVRGREHAGWSVAVSLVAPIAVITFSDYTVFDDRPADLPSVERYAEDAEGNRFDHAEHFRKMHGERAFQVLEKLRERIAAILEKHGVTVLPEAEWRKPVPWLRGGGDALVGEVVNQPVRVLDAFFFESI